jgi:hypothetical protein
MSLGGIYQISHQRKLSPQYGLPGPTMRKPTVVAKPLISFHYQLLASIPEEEFEKEVVKLRADKEAQIHTVYFLALAQRQGEVPRQRCPHNS